MQDVGRGMEGGGPDRKRLDGERNLDGRSEAGKEGGSETDRTKEEGKEGRREAGWRKTGSPSTYISMNILVYILFQ